jgi:hypothetical protein
LIMKSTKKQGIKPWTLRWISHKNIWSNQRKTNYKFHKLFNWIWNEILIIKLNGLIPKLLWKASIKDTEWGLIHYINDLSLKHIFNKLTKKN